VVPKPLRLKPHDRSQPTAYLTSQAGCSPGSAVSRQEAEGKQSSPSAKLSAPQEATIGFGSREEDDSSGLFEEEGWYQDGLKINKANKSKKN
jgi:hypothetical protein